jgi:hypothetical protein
MKRDFVKVFYVIALVVFLCCSVFTALSWGVNLNESSPEEEVENQEDARDVEEAEKKMKGIETPFIQNDGHIENEEVQFYTDISPGKFFITDNSLTYSIIKKESHQESLVVLDENREGPITLHEKKEEENRKVIAIKEKFINANGQINTFSPEGRISSKVKISHFKGKNKERWGRSQFAYESISLGQPWDDIDVEVRKTKNNVEKVFTVQPNGDPGEISISTEGVDKMSVADDGSLIYEIEDEKASMTAPVAYQLSESGEKLDISVQYKIIKEGVYSFEVGEYDENKPLIIDPLLAGTFLEGTDGSTDYPNIAIADDGSVYVASETKTTDYPTTTGAYDETYNGAGGDLVIAKFSSDLSQLLALTYLGGTGAESSWNTIIDFDQDGNVFVSLETSSEDFPATTGAYDTTYNGGSSYYGGDGAIAKFNNC